MQEEMTTVQKIIDKVIEYIVTYSFDVLGALIILGVGILLGNWVAKLIFSLLQKKKLDITLSKFTASICKILVIAFAVLIALGKFGITIAPFIAALGALAFGASFAIQGPLSNYGAGLSIILSRPFVVGNTITVAGVSGVVQEVKLAATILTDEEGVKITIPNKHIVGEIVQNSQANKMVHGVVGISYSDDPETAVRVVQETLSNFPEIVQDPKPQIGLQEFADSSLNIGFRYWVPTIKYYQTSFAVNLALHKALQQAGISIPFPQRDVHIVTQPAAIKS